MTAALLLRVLREPGVAGALPEALWDVLIRQARHANLLARLYLVLVDAGVEVPARPARHLLAAHAMAQRQLVAVRKEALALVADLSDVGVPLVLLKGAAYIMGGAAAARGRVFGDVDILVPREQLDAVEGALLQRGWSFGELDAYDQRYYRRWMHELPPLQHIFRGTALDVHHTLLPPTAGRRLNTARLLQDRIPAPGFPGMYTLCPTDMVLHSATHLFHEGEPDNLLRDLSDLDLLLRHFGQDATFWPALLARAELHDLVDDLRLAVRYAALLLGTPIPASLQSALQPQLISGLADRVRHAMFLRVLQPMHDTASVRWTRLSRWALYVRSHWLKMPLSLLILHLAHKAIFPPKTKQIDTDQR